MIIYSCPTCKSENLEFKTDAWATWDKEMQDFKLETSGDWQLDEDAFREAWCPTCEDHIVVEETST